MRGVQAQMHFVYLIRSSDFACLFARINGADGGNDAGRVKVSLLDLSAKLVRRFSLHQINGGAAETAAGHSRADYAIDPRRRVNHLIEFKTTDFIIIAQRIV